MASKLQREESASLNDGKVIDFHAAIQKENESTGDKATKYIYEQQKSIAKVNLCTDRRKPGEAARGSSSNRSRIRSRSSQWSIR